MTQSAIDQANANGPSTKINSDEMSQMASDLFTTMLDMPLGESSQTDILQCFQSGEALQASIQISGDWNAGIKVVASHELARRIAVAMFGKQPDELTNEEIHDALGEVINVIGGNAKGFVNRECDLSLPIVGPWGPTENNASQTVTFQCDGHPLSVLIAAK